VPRARGRSVSTARSPAAALVPSVRAAVGSAIVHVVPSPNWLFDDQRAAHGLGQALGESQAEPGALDARLIGTESIEGDEEALEHRGRDADAGVADGEPDSAVRRLF